MTLREECKKAALKEADTGAMYRHTQYGDVHYHLVASRNGNVSWIGSELEIPCHQENGFQCDIAIFGKNDNDDVTYDNWEDEIDRARDDISDGVDRLEFGLFFDEYEEDFTRPLDDDDYE